MMFKFKENLRKVGIPRDLRLYVAPSIVTVKNQQGKVIRLETPDGKPIK